MIKNYYKYIQIFLNTILKQIIYLKYVKHILVLSV